MPRRLHIWVGYAPTETAQSTYPKVLMFLKMDAGMWMHAAGSSHILGLAKIFVTGHGLVPPIGCEYIRLKLMVGWPAINQLSTIKILSIWLFVVEWFAMAQGFLWGEPCDKPSHKIAVRLGLVWGLSSRSPRGYTQAWHDRCIGGFWWPSNPTKMLGGRWG